MLFDLPDIALLWLALIEESWLLVLNAKFAVNGSKDALYLTKGEHAAE